jgi:hypothetical protein
VALAFPEFLPKFSEAGFARSSSLRDPLVTSDRLRLSKKRRPNIAMTKAYRMFLSPSVKSDAKGLQRPLPGDGLMLAAREPELC